MSASNVKKFIAKVEEKKSLQAKLKAMYNKTMEGRESQGGRWGGQDRSRRGLQVHGQGLGEGTWTEGEEVAGGRGGGCYRAGVFWTNNNYYCMSGWYCISQWVTGY